MQICVDNSVKPYFCGIKMTSANRADATALLNQYLKTPTLELRDEIFGILDPYMQRFAKKVAGNEFYYDDVLQNIRLNLFELLESEQAKQRKLDQYKTLIAEANAQHRYKLRNQLLGDYDRLPRPITTIKKFKSKLFHQTEHTQDAKIPQADKSLVSWNSLPYMTQERLIPSDTFRKMTEKETADFFINESKLTPYEKEVLRLFGKEGNNLDEIAKMYNLTVDRVRQIRNKAIRHIQRKYNIGKEGKEYRERLSVQKPEYVGPVRTNLDLTAKSDIIDLDNNGKKIDVWVGDV